MRVLFISSYYIPAVEWGGPAICVPAIAEGLRKLGTDVTVLTTNGRGNPGLPSIPPGLREVNAVPVYYFGRIGPARYFFCHGIIEYLARHLGSYDLIHIHGLWTFPVLISSRFCQIYKKPYLITLHGQLVEWAINRKKTKKRLYMSVFEANTIVHSELIHFTSEFEKQSTIKRYSNLKSVVIPNPVAVEKFLCIRPLSEEQCANRKVTFLIVGRLHPVKGFDLLLPALARAKAASDIELLIVGPDQGGYLTDITEMVHSLSLTDNVRYLGLLRDSDLLEAYERSQVIVVPSYQENFGMVAAEGMASARPVIVSNRVGISDIVAEQKAGWVCDLSVPSLTNAIKYVCHNPELLNETGLNGRKAALEHFTPESISARLQKAYENILRNKQFD
jgi:glycosyltransferase involved in cell wall biosynthesis